MRAIYIWTVTTNNVLSFFYDYLKSTFRHGIHLAKKENFFHSKRNKRTGVYYVHVLNNISIINVCGFFNIFALFIKPKFVYIGCVFGVTLKMIYDIDIIKTKWSFNNEIQNFSTVHNTQEKECFYNNKYKINRNFVYKKIIKLTTKLFKICTINNNYTIKKLGEVKTIDVRENFECTTKKLI